MSGHSKWTQIKRQKGTADQKRGAIFTKLANAISLAAREGGGNPDTNFKLRLAIDKAKSVNMPKDNIDRAIKRGAGELGGEKIEEIVYEGFGPEGIAVVIECLSTNRNRTASNIKNALTKYGGSLAGPNAVLWMFVKRGVIRIENYQKQIPNLNDLELELIDQGAIDIKDETGELEITTEPADLFKVKTFLGNKNINLDYSEIEYLPKETPKELNDRQKEKIHKLFEELDNLEEVSNFYSNAGL